MTRRRSFWLPALIAVLPAVVALADDQPVETQGGVTVGGGSVSGLNESSKYQEYREIPNGFFLSNLDFGLKKSEWTFDLQAVDLLQEDQRIVASLRAPGGVRLVVGYDQTPKWFSNTSATLFSSVGGGRLLFPETIRQQLESVTPGSGVGPLLQSSLNSAQPFVDLRYRRDKAFGELQWTTPVQGLTLRVGFDQEKRAGTQPLTMSTNFSVGPDITEFAAPTDYTTQNARVGLDYVHSIFWVGGELLWSRFFDNVTSSLSPGVAYESAYIVDNPLRATDGTPSVFVPAAPNNRAAAHLLLSAPPDSRSGWATVNGGVKIGAWGRIDLRYGVGQSKQDEPFLPFTLNTAIVPPSPLVILEGGAGGTPVSRYDGSIDLTNWDARFDGRPLKWFSFQVYGHGYEYDNKTPEYVIPNWVDADVELHNTVADAEPLSYKTTRYGATTTFRPLARLALDLGVERESWTRHARAAPSTDENIFKLQIAWEPAAWGRFRFGYRAGDRTYDSYTDDPADPPGLRPFDLANRDQKRYDLLADFTPVERFSFGLQFHETKSDYRDLSFGRLHDKSDGWAVDFSVDAGHGVAVTGNYGEDRYSWDAASQFRIAAGGPGDPANDWSMSPDDKIVSYGLGVNATLIPKRLTLDASGTVTDSTGSQPFGFAPGGLAAGDPTPYPDVTDKLVTLDAELRWFVKKGLAVAFAASHESWDVTNFQRDVMQPWMGALDPGSNESVYLGMRIPDYNVNWLRVLLSYSF